MPSQKKVDIVKKLEEKISRAKALIFTNYQGMTNKQLEDLKKALKTVDAELVVSKNTLLKLAFGKVSKVSKVSEVPKKALDISLLQGPTATLFAYKDPLAPLKELAKIIKTLKLPAIKFGILEGKLLAEADVLRLSTLPSREVLIAQVVGGMKSPIFGLHRALSWNLQKLVMTLRTIENSKK